MYLLSAHLNLTSELPPSVPLSVCPPPVSYNSDVQAPLIRPTNTPRRRKLKLKEDTAFRYLASLTSRWRTIGTLLEVDKHNMKMIEDNQLKCTEEDHLKELISLWLKGHSSPSWSTLAVAVEPIDSNEAIKIRMNC